MLKSAVETKELTDKFRDHKESRHDDRIETRCIKGKGSIFTKVTTNVNGGVIHG